MSIDETGQLLKIEGVTFSFQRYRSPATGLVDKLPTSLGTLPLFASKSRIILPVDAAEALWIGTYGGSLDVTVACSATLHDGRLVALHGTTDHILGLPMDRARTASLTRVATLVSPGVTSLAINLETDHGNLAVVVHLTSYETFESEAGFRPKPLDPDAGYKGHRLP